MAERQLNLFTSFAYTDAYWNLSADEQRGVRSELANQVKTRADATFFYSVYPARPDTDFLIWSAWNVADSPLAGPAFTGFAEGLEASRKFVRPVQTLWGFTRVSNYARGKSEQDMDPFEGERQTFLVTYPFSKTKDWYLMSMDARQGQMNEHIKLGKTYPEIKQLLLYSFGLQDQEFVVSYEMGDLAKFSELVNGLRATEARRHTLLDTPLITGVHRTLEEFVR